MISAAPVAAARGSRAPPERDSPESQPHPPDQSVLFYKPIFNCRPVARLMVPGTGGAIILLPSPTPRLGSTPEAGVAGRASRPASCARLRHERSDHFSAVARGSIGRWPVPATGSVAESGGTRPASRRASQSGRLCSPIGISAHRTRSRTLVVPISTRNWDGLSTTSTTASKKVNDSPPEPASPTATSRGQLQNYRLH